jgi:hypothetical protein
MTMGAQSDYKAFGMTLRCQLVLEGLSPVPSQGNGRLG